MASQLESESILTIFKECIIKAAKDIKSNDSTFQTNTLPENADKLRDLMNHYNSFNNRNIATDEAYGHLIDLIKVDDHETNEESIASDFDELIQKSIEQSQTADEPDATRQLNLLLVVENDDIDELETEQPKTVPRDPISRKEIDKAVKNKRCGHVYDKEGIEMLFQQKETNRRRVRCPQIGCTNLDMKREDIVDDEDTNRLIEQIRLNQSSDQ